jgi:tricorn protease
MSRLTATATAVPAALLVAVLVALPTALSAQGTRFLRDPDVGPSGIAFVHANDVWIVGRDGGQARRLTSGEGAETDPAFSPDGRWIAFTGEYGGNADVYVVAAEGGQPERLTWHPGEDAVQGWTPDGRVLFRSGRRGQPTRLWQWYTVPREGGLPEPVGVPQAYVGEMSGDGDWLAYQEIGFWDPEWRNYRGGQAQPVSVVSTTDWERRTPPWEGERQMGPVWLDGVVYYMSERDWAANVWSWDPATGRETQHTAHDDFDVKSLGAGDGVVVYEQAGWLWELDPASGSTRQLEIRAEADQNWARARWEEVEPGQLGNARLSPTGTRALFEHRGELFTVPAGEGSWRNLTRSSGVADRHPAWSPDGERIAWFNDDGEEYALVVADQDGANPRRTELPDPTFYFQPRWSPDGTRLAFTDTDYRILVVDVETGDVTHVDTDRYAHPERSMNPVWSPDSRWIAYARRLDTQYRAVFVHDTETGETHQLTDGMADAVDPVWDEGGDYLYFLASTDFGLNTGWLDMTSYDRPTTRSLYVAVLDEDGVSPFVPRSDEEGDEEPQAGGDGDEAQEDGEELRVEIDPDGIMDRIVAAPSLPARSYPGLAPGPEGHVFVLESVPNEPGAVLHRYSLEDREPTRFLEAVTVVEASHDRTKLLVRTGPAWRIVDAAGPPPDGDAGRLALDGLRVRVEPRAEYAQMLRDGWRFMRDFLYVDNAHGAPWDDVWAWYSDWLPDVEHRSDFNHLLDMMSGEIAVGHSYVRGGDYPELGDPGTGLLGVDLEEEDGFYRIAALHDGEDWNPGLRGPLTHPGMDVEVGDWLVAIDGQPLQAPTNPYRLLEATEGRAITVSVNDEPSREGARELVVEPVGSEGQLRTWAWVEENRRRVDEMSGGRLAYVWLPNTGQGGYTFFNRMYWAQQDRQGAVIDERNNGGGSAADYIVEMMDRELTGYFNSKAGDRKPWTQPMAGLFGPKVMVINERAGSGGDLMPYLFRFHDVGPLVGTRTWGGLVGTWDTPPLIDGGRFVAPRGGFINVDGEWAVEAVGVAPDIEVRNDPAEVRQGRDPQLEAAVQEALRLLETEGVELLETQPPPPIRYGRPGNPPQDGPGAPGGGSGGGGDR